MPGKKETKTANFAVRIEESLLVKFKKRCNGLRRHYSDVLRELMTAFAENRITIKRDKKSEELYK